MARRLRRVADRSRRDERGAVLVMSIAGLVLALVATALSVDIGRQAVMKREDQSIADMAALDAARALANVQPAAEQSARRNGFDPSAPGNSVVAERGTVDAANNFTPDPNGTAVRVTVGSNLDYVFAPGGRGLTARAVAKMSEPTAKFGIGSSLAGVNLGNAPFVNSILGPMIGGNANVVGWQGLASSYVTLGALQQQLATAGFQVGTVDELLNADITLADLAQATADALSASGDSNASLFSGPNGITAQSTNTTTFKLGDFIDVAQGTGSAALAGTFNVWSLLTASAVVANGSNLISVPNATVTVPGVATTGLSLSVIEGPKWAVGPADGSTTATTGQVQLTLTTTLDMPISVVGLVGARVTGSFPITITAAGATGTLTDITCPNPNGGITVQVDTQPFSGSGSATLRVSSVLPLVGSVPVLDVPTTGTIAATAPTTTDLTFAYPSDFTPSAPGQQTGSTPAGLGGLVSLTQSGSPTVLGAISVPPATIVSAVFAGLNGVIGDIDTDYLSPLLSSLGVTLGATDVWADTPYFAGQSGCDKPQYPVLVG